MKRIFLLLSLISTNAMADMTGTGDAALYAQMVQAVAVMKEQLVEMRKTYSLTENLKEMEQLKEIKEISKFGKGLMKMASDGRDIVDELNAWKDDPFGSKDVEKELIYLDEALAEADGKSGFDKMTAYGRVLKNLQYLNIVGQGLAETKQEMAEGVSEADANRITANNTLIMAELLRRESSDEEMKQATNIMVFDSAMRQSSYSGIGGLK